MNKSPRFSPGKLALYCFLLSAALFFALPLYVMLSSSFKSMAQIQQGDLLSLPWDWQTTAWRSAWSEACTGVACEGIRGGFWNSIAISVPATLLPVALGALNGYALTFWRKAYADKLFSLLLIAAFIPLQVMIFPLVKVLAALGWYASLPGIVCVHTVFALPMMSLLFRNYYLSIPQTLVQAARVDGAGFWRIFLQLMLPMSLPMLAVAGIMQWTGVWNDYLLGLIFAGRDFAPMTVQLNNLITTTTGTRLYNVNMAATLLTAALPLLLYFVCGRWLVRGITAGAVKG